MLSLIVFHRVLIGTAILFCFGYAGWELMTFWVRGGTGSLVLGVVFVVLGVGLVVYLARLRSILGYEEPGAD